MFKLSLASCEHWYIWNAGVNKMHDAPNEVIWSIVQRV